MGIEVFASALVALAGGLVFDPNNLKVSECSIGTNYTCYRSDDMLLISNTPNEDFHYYEFGVIETENPIGALDCHNGALGFFENHMVNYKYEKFKISRCTFPSYVLSSFLSSQKQIKYLFVENISMKKLSVIDYVQFRKKVYENPGTDVAKWVNDRLKLLHADSMTPPDIMQENLFSGLVHVKQISLVNTELTRIKNDRFMDQNNLTELDLNDNKIHTIEDNAFVNLKSLEVLNLQNNKLVSLSTWFIHFRNLRIFNASRNNIRTIERPTFANLANLKSLDLSRNDLSYSEVKMLINKNISSIAGNGVIPVHLKIDYLNLSYNKIANIDDSWDCFMQFITLDLSNNDINHFMVNTIRLGSQHSTINLSHNKLQKINILAIESKFMRETNVKFILKNNQIECDCGLNELVKNLKTNSGFYDKIIVDIDNSSVCVSPINLRRQPIKTLTSQILKCECPKGCSCLFNMVHGTQILECYNANLPLTVPEYLLFDKVTLKFGGDDVDGLDSSMIETSGRDIVGLDLSGNKISDVSKIHLPDNIKILDLRRNNIEHVTKGTVRMLNQYRYYGMYLYITDNPIVCDCENWEFISYLQEKEFTDALSMTCEGGQTLRQVSPMICYRKIYIILAGIGIFIVLLALLCCCCKSTQKNKSKKKFDVYLAHAPIDSPLVLNKIVPMLLDRGLRVLGDDRYFNRGEGMVELIGRCDIIIMVISPTFINVVLSRPNLVAILGNLIVERPADINMVRYEGHLEHAQLVKCGGSSKDPEFSLRLGLRSVRCYRLMDPEFLDRLPKGKGLGKVKYMQNEEAVELL